MSDYGVFESINGSEGERKVASRETQRKLDAAIDDVKRQYGAFLFASRDGEEWNDRVALCKNDMLKTIDAHIFPVTGVVRRIVKACKDEWRFRVADKTGPAMDNDVTFAPKKDKDLKPKGDFDAYLNKVDQNSDEVENCFKEGSRRYADWWNPFDDELGPGGEAIGQMTRAPWERGADGTMDFRNPFYNDDAPTVANPGGSGEYREQYNKENAAAEDAGKYDDDGPIGDPTPATNVSGPAAAAAAPAAAAAAAPAAASAASASNEGGGNSTPASSPMTSGDVADGGRAGAENGNNEAIKGNSYIVQEGDTLTDIAQRGFGDMNMYDDLAKTNNISNPDQISVGQEIKSGDTEFSGNNNIPGNLTNPAGGGSDGKVSTPNTGPAAPPEVGVGGVSTSNGLAGGAPAFTTASLALNQYIDWCDSFGLRRASVKNLDKYAERLNDQAYFEIASALTDPSSPIYLTAAGGNSGAPQSMGNSAPQSGPTTGGGAPEIGGVNWNVITNPYESSQPEAIEPSNPYGGLTIPENYGGGNAGAAAHFGAYLKLCRQANIQPTNQGFRQFVAQAGPGKSKSGKPIDTDMLKSLLAQSQNIVTGARMRTAAPDYLQKADEALTNLLNQKAEEFQETIAPLQQALQTVQQAEAAQQAANPLGVQPPAGTVNVLPPGPGGDPSGGGMPPAGGDPMGGMDPSMMMGGGDPSGGMGGDPAAMMGGGAPPMGDPSQMQMQARRRRQAGTDSYPTPEHLWEGQGPDRDEDGRPLRNSTPSEVERFSDAARALRGGMLNTRQAWNEDDDDLSDYYERQAFGESWKPAWDKEIPSTSKNPKKKPKPEPEYQGRHRAEAKRGGRGKAQGANAPRRAGIVNDVDEWGKGRGVTTGNPEVDLAQFESETGTTIGPKQRNKLTKPKPVSTANPMPRSKQPITTKMPKSASFFTRKVAGWEWDDHLNGYLASKNTPFTCKCGSKHPVPSYSTCKCGKIYNSYVIGTGGDNHQASVEKFICREIPVRDNVIVANRKTAKDGGCTCWEGYERVPGTKPCADGSCRKKSAEKVKRHKLTDPGPLGGGKDDKMPSISEELGEDWYKRGPGGKYAKGNRRSR